MKKETERSTTNKRGIKIDKQNDTAQKKIEYTYKYSNRGKVALHEAIILACLPKFLKYENGKIEIVDQIKVISRILKPPNAEEYPYEAYEFEDLEDLRTCFEKAKSETFDTMYEKAKQIFQKYNDQDEVVIVLNAADTILSYFQDLFPATHYLGVTGDNDVGKSSLGYTFEYTGYRPVKGTAIVRLTIIAC